MKASLLTQAVVWMTAMAMAISGATTMMDAPARSYTTGMPTEQDYRPVLVQLSNSEAGRPQLGLKDADIVYEAISDADGGTRYLALYNDAYPQYAGYLQSINLHDAQLRQQWDCPIISNGAQSAEGADAYTYFRDHGVVVDFRFDATRAWGTTKTSYGRVQGKTAPDDMVISLAMHARALWPTNEDTFGPYAPQMPALRFSAMPTQGDVAVNTIALDYDGDRYRPSYSYDEGTRQWIRAYDGKAHVDELTKVPITCANVIVQACETAYTDGDPAYPLTETTGSGAIIAFMDGYAVEGTWTRETADDPVVYQDTQGAPLVLRRGKTFIQIVPPQMLTEAVIRDGTASFTNE